MFATIKWKWEGVKDAFHHAYIKAFGPCQTCKGRGYVTELDDECRLAWDKPCPDCAPRHPFSGHVQPCSCIDCTRDHWLN